MALRLLLFAPGVVMLGIALILAGFSWSFELSSAQATGTVTGNDVQSDSDGSSYHPMVDFQAADGKTYSFTSNNGSSPPAFKRGEKVPVLYNPAKPTDAIINTFFSRWLAPLVLSVIGGGMTIGIWFLWRVLGSHIGA